MHIGIVTIWANRGQATVARQLRSAFESLGHRTFVLARPVRTRAAGAVRIATDDVWAQAGVTHASDYEIPAQEYLGWAREHAIEAVFCDQNYQFAEMEQLRALGVRTVGRFVWEKFAARDVAPARRGYDVVYSLTRCEQERYDGMGIPSPRVRWGCHPEWTTSDVPKRSDATWYLFPAGGLRKPLAETLGAFNRVEDPSIRLLVKRQETRNLKRVDEDLLDDPRIETDESDLPWTDYHRLLAACHVCLAPSRWEGLGLHLYEASACGLPIITTDIPPINEIVHDGRNGLLVRAYPKGTAKSGIPSYEPDVEDMARAIRELADPPTLAELSRGARAFARTELDWQITVRDLGDLVARL